MVVEAVVRERSSESARTAVSEKQDERDLCRTQKEEAVRRLEAEKDALLEYIEETRKANLPKPPRDAEGASKETGPVHF